MDHKVGFLIVEMIWLTTFFGLVWKTDVNGELGHQSASPEGFLARPDSYHTIHLFNFGKILTY